MKKVVVVGGGFGGLNAAKALARCSDVELELIDRRNHHLFQPLLYQVAMAGLSPAEIAVPIRSILSRGRRTLVRLANVQSVDLSKKTLATDGRSVPYDYLILACGSKHSYFGHSEWEPDAPGLKTLEQATEIRRRVLLAFELAEGETDPHRQKQLLSFIVVGAGPTGVELAGALGEISRFTLSRDFKRIDPARTRVILIEAGPRILASFSERLAKRAARDLENLGVQIWTSSRVTGVNSNGVQLGAEFLEASTVLWAAGVQPSSLGKSLGVPLDKMGRVIVQPDLSLEKHPEVFVIGDQANCQGEDGQPLPGLAPVAIQQGIVAAKNIVADLRGKPRTSFRYWDKGQMATIGRKKAVVQMKRLQFGGFLAWVAWLLIHIYYLIGFRNRVFVLIEWAWAYLTFGRGARLIVQKEWRSYAAVIFFALACGSALGVTLDEAYRAALGKVESVEIQRARLGQTDEQVKQAWGSLLPSISLLAGYQRQDSPPSSGVTSQFTLAEQWNSRVTLAQPLFRGFAEYAGLRAAKASQRAQTAQVDQARVSLFSSVASAYYAVASADQDKQNLEMLIELTERRVKDLKERSRIGRSREGEVLTARAQLAVLQSQLQAAVSVLAQARDRFALATGLARDSVLKLEAGHGVRLPKLGKLDEYLRLVEERPDIRALKDEVVSADEGVVIARAGHWPSLDLTGNYHLKRAGIQQDVKWDLGVTLTVPIFQGGVVSSAVRSAVSVRKEQELLLAQSRRTAETEIRNAYQSLSAGMEQVSTLGEAAEIADKNYRKQVADYRLGLVTNLDVLQALNMLQETKRSLDRIRYETLTAWATLQASVGKTL